MVTAIDGFVGDVGLFEDFAELSVNASVLAFPEGAKRIVVGVAGFGGGRRSAGQSIVGRVLDEVGTAVGAARKAGTIFDVALRAEHGGKCTTKWREEESSRESRAESGPCAAVPWQ